MSFRSPCYSHISSATPSAGVVDTLSLYSLASSGASTAIPYSTLFNSGLQQMSVSNVPHPAARTRRSASTSSVNTTSSGGSTSFLSWISSTKTRPSSLAINPLDREPSFPAASSSTMHSRAKDVGRSLKSFIGGQGAAQGRKRSASISGLASSLSPTGSSSFNGVAISRPIPITGPIRVALPPASASAPTAFVDRSGYRLSSSHISLTSTNSTSAGQSVDMRHASTSHSTLEPIHLPDHPYRAASSALRPSLGSPARPRANTATQPARGRPGMTIDTSKTALPPRRSSLDQHADGGLYGAPSPSYKSPARVLRPNPNATRRPSIVSPLLQSFSRPNSAYQPAQGYSTQQHARQASLGSDASTPTHRTSLYASSSSTAYGANAVTTRMARSATAPSQVSSAYQRDQRHEALSQLEGRSANSSAPRRHDPISASMPSKSNAPPLKKGSNDKARTSAPFLELDDEDDDSGGDSSKGRSTNAPALLRPVATYAKPPQFAASGYSKARRPTDYVPESPIDRALSMNMASAPTPGKFPAPPQFKVKSSGYGQSGGLQPPSRPSSRNSSTCSEAPLDRSQLDMFPLPPIGSSTMNRHAGYSTNASQSRSVSKSTPYGGGGSNSQRSNTTTAAAATQAPRYMATGMTGSRFHHTPQSSTSSSASTLQPFRGYQPMTNSVSVVSTSKPKSKPLPPYSHSAATNNTSTTTSSSSSRWKMSSVNVTSHHTSRSKPIRPLSRDFLSMCETDEED